MERGAYTPPVKGPFDVLTLAAAGVGETGADVEDGIGVEDGEDVVGVVVGEDGAVVGEDVCGVTEGE